MTFYLITSLIASIIIKRITAITNEANVNPLSIPYDSPKPVPITIEDIDEVKFDNEVDNSTESITSQDRISSYYTKRGPSYPYRVGHHHHYHPHHHHIHPHHHHHRSPYHRPRKKYRRGRRKPSMSRPYMRGPNKRQKPILLSEVLRNGGRLPYSKIKPVGPIIKDYIEDDDLETSPFSAIDTVESYPSFSKFTRPQSFEITDESPDVLPVQPIEEEIIFPGISNVKPFSATVKRPQNSIWSLSKPSEVYYDSDSQDNIRNVRFANKPSYLDKDVMNLLQKIKLEGMTSDSKPSSSETTTQSQNKDNFTDVNSAISKLLFPFLSDTAIKQIQLYFKSLPSDKQHKEDDHNSLENQIREYTKNTTPGGFLTQNPPPKQYSVTESIKEDESDNSTYFIMVKSPNYKGLNLTKILTQQFDQQQWSNNQTEQNGRAEFRSTTPPSKESIALQKYIMMLAGITKDLGNGDNYLPRFSAFQKQKRNF